jgi:hypothetical protein
MDGVIGGRQKLYEDGGFVDTVFGAMLNGLVAFQKGRPGNLVPSAILAGALGLLLASFWLFVRLTRWPLANLVICLAALAGLVFLPAILAAPLGRELLSFVPLDWKNFVLPGMYLLASILCFGGCLLLPSTKDWQPGADE